MKTTVQVNNGKAGRPIFTLSEMMGHRGLFEVRDTHMSDVRIISFGTGRDALYVSGNAVQPFDVSVWDKYTFSSCSEEITITFKP